MSSVGDPVRRGRGRIRLTIGRRLAGGYALALALTGGIGYVAVSNTDALVDNSAMVTHTHEVLDATTALLSGLKDAETGQRGFLITGADAYLEPYTSARRAVDEALARAIDLTSDNAEQQARLDRLAPLLDEKFAEMQSTIDVSRSEGFEAAREVVLSDAGKAVMDEIRVVLDEVVAAEQALLVERDAAAATATATRAAVLGGSALAVVLLVAVATVVTRSITRPITALTTRLAEIADGDGDLTQRVDAHDRDEIGVLGGVFNRFVENIADLVRRIGRAAASSSAAAQELSAISAEMTRQAESSAEQADLAAAAAQQVSGNVETVAAASEQMGASISEIARSASDASRAGHTAVARATEANTTVARLGESSAAVGGVVKAITSIAEQTNLLALNATIEAARAGDAGKGFAVVAGEVKELAQETGRATEEITARIAGIQQDIERAVGVISATTEVIGEVNDHQSSIAGAVEEQSTTTGSVTSSVAEAATGARSIAENVRKLADNAQATVGSVDQVRTATDELARTAQDLDRLVGQFRA